LLIASAVSLGVALLLAAAGLGALFQQHVERRVEAELAAHLEQLLANVERDPQGMLRLARQPADPRFSAALSGLYWQIEVNDSFLRSRSLWDQRLALPADVAADGDVHRHRILGPAGAELLALERAAELPKSSGGELLRVGVAIDVADIFAARDQFMRDLLPYLGLIGALLMLATWAQVRVGLSPLAAVRDRLSAINEGQARRLGQRFPNEVQPLAEQVDRLLEAQESELERARQRASDLAHGLKTPLQVLTGDIETLRERQQDDIAGEIEKVASLMRRHVDRELARARLAADRGEVQSPLLEIVRRLIAVVSRSPDGSRLVWDLEVQAGVHARIDPDDLSEALGNLLENAARHARTRILVKSVFRDDMVSLNVLDDGSGIPPAHLEAVQSRGVRLDENPAGTGLGLSITRDIVEAWGGALELASREVGFEARIILRPA
jgi:signal transduction histidine kinase